MPPTFESFNQLATDIKRWAYELGFHKARIGDTDLRQYHEHYRKWLANHYHGTMEYMARNVDIRFYPEKCVAETLRVISVTMNYLPPNSNIQKTLQDREKAFISRYAVGGDYHKLVRKRLQQLADKITEKIGSFGYRAFADSAPVMEKALAEKAGIGWIGKHTNVLNRESGSWFFLGELYTDIPLPLDEPAINHCGSCTGCMTICPTQAIVAPYQLDARRCISYLTIENKGSIPIEFRKAMGNRVYGCDDCQLVCPWNRFAKFTHEKTFRPRHNLDSASLVELFLLTQEEFLIITQGSAIKRIGYLCWLRNLAVGLGNAPSTLDVINALKSRADHASDMVREHVIWALEQHKKPPSSSTMVVTDPLVQITAAN